MHSVCGVCWLAGLRKALRSCVKAATVRAAAVSVCQLVKSTKPERGIKILSLLGAQPPSLFLFFHSLRILHFSSSSDWAENKDKQRTACCVLMDWLPRWPKNVFFLFTHVLFVSCRSSSLRGKKGAHKNGTMEMDTMAEWKGEKSRFPGVSAWQIPTFIPTKKKTVGKQAALLSSFTKTQRDIYLLQNNPLKQD